MCQAFTLFDKSHRLHTCTYSCVTSTIYNIPDPLKLSDIAANFSTIEKYVSSQFKASWIPGSHYSATLLIWVLAASLRNTDMENFEKFTLPELIIVKLISFLFINGF